MRQRLSVAFVVFISSHFLVIGNSNERLTALEQSKANCSKCKQLLKLILSSKPLCYVDKIGHKPISQITIQLVTICEKLKRASPQINASSE